MADIKSASASDAAISAVSRQSEETASSSTTRPSPHAITEAVELLFFAYRDFVSDPDAVLARDGFGRAHHRVLHFVHRHPGITVADLLEILRITKQSLSRVLRDLIDKGLVVQQPGSKDRRKRLLFLTEEGEQLFAEVSQPQRERVARALSHVGSEGMSAWRHLMMELVDPDKRAEVERLLAGGVGEQGEDSPGEDQ